SVNGAASACLALVTIMTAQALLPLEKARDTIQFWGQASERVIDFFHDVGDLLGTGFTSFTHFGTPQLDSSGYMAGGGINTSGSLSISNPTISGRPVLNVTLDYNHSPVYLRSDIGSSYDAVRERWNIDSRANNMRGFPDNFYPEHEYLIFRQKVSNLGYLVDSLIGRQSVTVEHLVRTPHIMLPTSPYLPSYKSDPRFTWRNDTVLNRRGSNNPQVYNWSALYPRHSNHLGNAIDDVQQLIQGVRPLSGAEASLYAISGSFEDYIFLEKFNEDASITEGALRIYVTEYGLSAEEYLHYLALYEEMVYDVYLEVTASESANIQLAISNVVGGDTVIDDYGMTWTGGTPLHRMDNYQKAFAIENYFKTNFTYSLIVDNHSGNNSYLGNFLHESQAGHCALYATAMTLMLRELGIPARYVTGFVAGGANASLFGDGGDRVLHVIRERDLHAWVEVYFPGVGWLPFDPTPPIYDYMFLEAEAGVTVTITTTTAPPVTTTTPIVTTTTPVVTTPNPIITTPSASPPAQSGEAPEQPVQKPDYTALLLAVLMITLIILLIAGIIAAVVMFFKGIERAEKRRLAKYAKLCEPETAREAYRFMLKLLKMEKLTAMAGETPVKFALRIDEAIAEPVLASAIDATLKLEFSREELKAEEYAQLSAAVEGLYKQIVTEQKRFKRLARRIVALGVIK
ncbi:MAG: transglutaminase-like domain-containing protein, partial [Oscillospiraceae bacterium]|nr:transglutaminase-like domain-containing protein [Oscillospiraceae bacterium]